jgi:type VI secretion system protein ImpH
MSTTYQDSSGGHSPQLPEGAVVGSNKLLTRLAERGWEFSFFQAVWLLERAFPDRIGPGQRGPIRSEGIRFRPDLSMGFPATDVRRVSRCKGPDGGDYFRVEPTFIGLYGVATPLPLHYAVRVLKSVESVTREGAPGPQTEAKREDPGSSRIRDFLDLLHHRVISLFYRAWAKYRYYATFGMPGRDAITPYLLGLIGLHPSWDKPLLGISPVKMIRYAGLLTQRPRGAAGLEGLLRDFFVDVPARLRQLIGRWVSLRETDLCRVGMANSSLGVDTIAGEQVYDLSGAFRLSFGPVDWETYHSFLPDGSRFAQACSLARLYCTDPLAFTIEVTLRAGEVPEMHVASEGGARLGFTSWVRTADLPETSVIFEASV